jgi:hypothetical protein
MLPRLIRPCLLAKIVRRVMMLPETWDTMLAV